MKRLYYELWDITWAIIMCALFGGAILGVIALIFIGIIKLFS